MIDKEQLEIRMQTFDCVQPEEKQYRGYEIRSLSFKAYDNGAITMGFLDKTDAWLFSCDEPVTDDDEYFDH